MTKFKAIVSEGFQLEKVQSGRKETELMRFRHQIFREELRWLPESQDGLDRDDYDPFSDNFAVSKSQKVVGSVRITPGNHPFMIEREFLPLLPHDCCLEKSLHSAEITRFAVGLDEHGRRPEVAAHLLYFSLYQWARAHRTRWMYFVVEPCFFRHIVRLKFPAFALGKAQPLDGGVMCQAGFLDWNMADSGFIRWLQSVTAAPAASQAQSRASGYSH